jgi:hypothetical protein
LEDDQYVDSQSKDEMINSANGIQEKIAANDNDVVASDGGVNTIAIVLGVLILLILVAVAAGVILHRKNVHPKVLVRPYVQQW